MTNPPTPPPPGETPTPRMPYPLTATDTYAQPTPRTEAFLDLIDDSEIDLGQVQAFCETLEGELKKAQRELAAAQDAVQELETKLDMAQAANRHLERQLAKHAPKEETKL